MHDLSRELRFERPAQIGIYPRRRPPKPYRHDSSKLLSKVTNSFQDLTFGICGDGRWLYAVLALEVSEFDELGLDGVCASFPFEVVARPGAGVAGGAALEFVEAVFEGLDDLFEGRVGDAAWVDAVFAADFV
jgi:hypothetical protein